MPFSYAAAASKITGSSNAKAQTTQAPLTVKKMESESGSGVELWTLTSTREFGAANKVRTFKPHTYHSYFLSSLNIAFSSVFLFFTLSLFLIFSSSLHCSTPTPTTVHPHPLFLDFLCFLHLFSLSFSLYPSLTLLFSFPSLRYPRRMFPQRKKERSHI